ncbi:MAG: hypothetical protein Q9227_004153 [Pyrenula ochraceoflavens]
MSLQSQGSYYAHASSMGRHPSQHGREGPPSREFSTPFGYATANPVVSPEYSSRTMTGLPPPFGAGPGGIRVPHASQVEWEYPANASRDYPIGEPDSPVPGSSDFVIESSARRGIERPQSGVRYHSQRKPSNRDEFDGPHQLLQPPSPNTIAAQERELLHLPTNLDVQEQDEVLARVNDCLSKCAFDFVAKYQFPIPIEPDKRQVRTPADREWTEWVHLLKRLATKRRIPARVLYNNQIKQLVTVLENSLEMRHAAKHQSRPLKDDRNVLQLISAGTQVAKILKDAAAMDYLDKLYVGTEMLIQERREKNRRAFSS